MPGNIYRCSVRVYKASKDVKLSRCTRMKRGRPCLRQYGRKFFNLGGSNGLFYQSIRVFSDFFIWRAFWRWVFDWNVWACCRGSRRQIVVIALVIFISRRNSCEIRIEICMNRSPLLANLLMINNCRN